MRGTLTNFVVLVVLLWLGHAGLAVAQTDPLPSWREGLAKAARRSVGVRVIGNRIKRALVAKHVLSELADAGLPRLSTTLSDVVAYVELTHTGKLPTANPAAAEITALVGELRELGWLPG